MICQNFQPTRGLVDFVSSKASFILVELSQGPTYFLSHIVLEHEDMVEDCEVTMMEDVIMQSEVWKELPCDLQAHILHFCSVPQLCRLRIVCRAWNDLTHKLGFALKFQPQHTYIFKAPRFINIYSITHEDNVDAIEQIREEKKCTDTITH